MLLAATQPNHQKCYAQHVNYYIWVKYTWPHRKNIELQAVIQKFINTATIDTLSPI